MERYLAKNSVEIEGFVYNCLLDTKNPQFQRSMAKFLTRFIVQNVVNVEFK